MTMSLLPGVDGALDVCDITVIIERNAQSCTIYLRGNSAVACNAPASDVADAINDGATYILPGIPSTVGVVWVNGQNVLRLTEDPASGGTIVQMEVGGGTFAIPSLPLALAIEGVNDCARCGGGGGLSSPFVEAAEFNLVISAPGGGTASQNGPTQYLRVGPPGSTVAAVGDRVWWQTRVFVQDIPPGNSLNIIVGAPQNAPNVGTCCTSNVRVIAGNPADWAQGLLINREDSNGYYVQAGPASVLTTLMIDLGFIGFVDGN